jgi:regulator of sirC expression with transglutaminase-like and TPR domain
MALQFDAPTPLQYFATLVADDETLPLLEAAACLAQDEYPDGDVQQVLDSVDQLAQRLRRRLSPDADPLQRLRMLNQFFFKDLGFAGNVNHYHDPDNSYLHVVLRTRRGIPVSLAVLWLELAQGLRLKARGINFPGHFLVKVNLPAGQVVIDPFSGESLSREALSERLLPYQQSRGMVGEFEVPMGLYLQSATPRDILVRMLRNLKDLHRSQADVSRLLAVQERLVILLPDHWPEWRDRGLAHAELGNTREAVADLERYCAETDDALDRDLIEQRIQALRREMS